MVIPSTPGLPLFLRTRFHAISRFSRLHTSSISCSAEAGLLDAGFAANGSALGEPPERASPPPAGSKATEQWVFCRVPLMRRQSYLPLPIVRAFSYRFRLRLSVCSAFRLGVPHEPCRLRGLLCPLLTSAPRSVALRLPQFPSWRRSQISQGKFDRLPRTLPDLQTWPLMDMDFATCCPLVRPRMPPIRFLSVRPRFCSALPSDAASRRPPLCFANPSPPSGWTGDFHPQALEHAWHTTNTLRVSLLPPALCHDRAQ